MRFDQETLKKNTNSNLKPSPTNQLLKIIHNSDVRDPPRIAHVILMELI